MRKILISLILMLAGSTVYGQLEVVDKNWYIIPAADSAYYLKKRVTWWYGINAVPLKSGDYTLPARVMKELEKFDLKSLEFRKKDASLAYYDLELKKLSKTLTPDLKEGTIPKEVIIPKNP